MDTRRQSASSTAIRPPPPPTPNELELNSILPSSEKINQVKTTV